MCSARCVADRYNLVLGVYIMLYHTCVFECAIEVSSSYMWPEEVMLICTPPE